MLASSFTTRDFPISAEEVTKISAGVMKPFTHSTITSDSSIKQPKIEVNLFSEDDLNVGPFHQLETQLLDSMEISEQKPSHSDKHEGLGRGPLFLKSLENPPFVNPLNRHHLPLSFAVRQALPSFLISAAPTGDNSHLGKQRATAPSPMEEANLPQSNTLDESTTENINNANPPPVVPSSKKKPSKPRSEVWEHFTKFIDEDGEVKGRCNYCPKVYCCDSKRYGTSTLKSHMSTCLHNPKNVDASQPQLSLKPREGKSHMSTCLQNPKNVDASQSQIFLKPHEGETISCRKNMVEMIVTDELPFKHIEGEGFRPRSEVWEHFTKFTDKDGEVKGKCNYCPKVYCCDSKRYGTSTLKNHMSTCLHNPKNVDASQPQIFLKPREGETTGTITCWKFDQDICRKSMVEMIVIDELPFKHIEGEGFVKFVANLQPEFKIPSRWTVSRDIFQLYLAEKLKLQEYFKTSGMTVCITTDIWTSEQKINYMCITAHYIDKDWKLHKKIINFCVVDGHKGEEMGRQIDSCLRDWGIARVFAITVHNIISNDYCVNFLKGELTSRGCDVVKGEHLHMRCAAHVVNLIVGEGLKVLNLAIKRVRDAVIYVRHSQSRLDRFKECCVDEDIESLLCLDVATRWNSTYLMLSVALKFEKAFERFEGVDLFFHRDLEDGAPTSSDWEIVRIVVDILVVFYELTLRVSTQLYVTSHLIFHEIDTVGNLLRDWLGSPNADIKEMAMKMQAKYDKYWGHYRKMNKIVYLAVVIDPRFKLAFINYYFREEYGDEEGSKLAFDLKTTLDNLYKHYQQLHRPKSQAPPPLNQKNDATLPPPLKKVKYTRMDRYKRQMDDDDDDLKNDLEIYLSEKALKNEKDDFDILKWWDTHQCRFPVLSHLARDILSMPTSTVPSECAFNTEGRVLDPFRSSLSTELVEALICTQDWLKKSREMITIEEDLASLEKHEQGCNEKGKDASMP